MSFSLGNLLLPVLNHLLANESWARARLLPFAGQVARVSLSQLQIDLAIGQDGMFTPADRHDQRLSVTITLPDETLGKLMIGDKSSVFSAARISGSAEFAEALAFVFRQLEWDAEADLAGVVGDVAAVRTVQLARSFLNWQQSAARKMAENIQEYFTEESAEIVRQPDINALSQQIETIRDDVARLEKRIIKLERS